MKSIVAIVACFFAVVLASCASGVAQPGTVAEGDVARLLRVIDGQLRACWKPVRGANLIVRVYFRLNKDGSLAGIPTVAKTATGPEFEAAAESAVRAVRQCTPLKLPADKYENWREIEAAFDPRTI